LNLRSIKGNETKVTTVRTAGKIGSHSMCSTAKRGSCAVNTCAKEEQQRRTNIFSVL